MRKKSKLLCYLVAIIMVATLIPATAFAADPEAKVVEDGKTIKEYTTLNQAISAVGPGRSVEVLRDITLEGTVKINRANANIKIDLKGNTISANGFSCIEVLKAANVELSNGTLTCTPHDVPCINIALENEATPVTLNNINAANTDVGNESTAINVSKGKVDIDGGVYEGKVNAIAVSNAGEVIIKSGSFKGGTGAVSITAPGTADVDPNSFVNANGWKTANSFHVYNKAAKIGSNEYGSLQTAVNVVGDGQTIEVQEDMHIGNYSVSIDREGVDFKIDLNGKTITSNYSGFKVANVGNLEIIDGSMICLNNYQDDDACLIAENGEITLEKFNASNTKNEYAIKTTGGNVTIKSGTFETIGGSAAISINGGSIEKDSLTVVPDNWKTLQSFTAEYLPVTAITISGSSTVAAGSLAKMTAKITPTNAKVPDVAWKSSSTSIAKVSSTGTVTGVKPGKVTITATATDRNTVKKTKTVYVVPKKAAMSKVTAKTAGFTAYASKQTGISGYEFQYKKGTKGTLKTVRTTSYYKSISKLTRKATYYVKVRTYKTIDGKRYYGAWSAFKSVKTK